MKEIWPYDFRRTFVGALLDAVGGLSAAQKLAGRSDPVIARYDWRGERAARQAASHLHVSTWMKMGALTAAVRPPLRPSINVVRVG